MNFESNLEDLKTQEESKQRDGLVTDASASERGRNNNAAKSAFPFTLLYKLHDQMDEIVDIDTN